MQLEWSTLLLCCASHLPRLNTPSHFACLFVGGRVRGGCAVWTVIPENLVNAVGLRIGHVVMGL